MKRRNATSALIALAGSAATPSLMAADPPRVGVLLLTSLATATPSMDGFRSSLRELGLVDGRNIHLEVLSAEGNADRLPELAAQHVARKVDIIVTGGNASTIAARNRSCTAVWRALSTGYSKVPSRLICR